MNVEIEAVENGWVVRFGYERTVLYLHGDGEYMLTDIREHLLGPDAEPETDDES